MSKTLTSHIDKKIFLTFLLTSISLCIFTIWKSIVYYRLCRDVIYFDKILVLEYKLFKRSNQANLFIALVKWPVSQIKMAFQEIRIIATGPCISNQLRDVNTICRRSWYIAAHIWKIHSFKIEVVLWIKNSCQIKYLLLTFWLQLLVVKVYTDHPAHHPLSTLLPVDVVF